MATIKRSLFDLVLTGGINTLVIKYAAQALGVPALDWKQSATLGFATGVAAYGTGMGVRAALPNRWGLGTYDDEGLGARLLTWSNLRSIGAPGRRGAQEGRIPGVRKKVGSTSAWYRTMVARGAHQERQQATASRAHGCDYPREVWGRTVRRAHGARGPQVGPSQCVPNPSYAGGGRGRAVMQRAVPGPFQHPFDARRHLGTYDDEGLGARPARAPHPRTSRLWRGKVGSSAWFRYIVARGAHQERQQATASRAHGCDYPREVWGRTVRRAHGARGPQVGPSQCVPNPSYAGGGRGRYAVQRAVPGPKQSPWMRWRHM